MIDLPSESAPSLGFIPAAWLVLSREGLSLDEAMAPERCSMLLPVPQGDAQATFDDARLPIYLNSGAAVILAFEDQDDAGLFDRLTQSEDGG